MEISRVTIHQIIKEQGISYTELIESNGLITIGENVQNLIDVLNDSFKKDEKVIRSEFLEEQNSFQTSLRTFCQETNNQNFLTFSTDSIRRINDLLTGANLATGGYFVYAEYEYRNRTYVSVFLVRDSEELIFDRGPDDNSFVVNKTTIIDTKKLAMAVRIDKAKLLNNQERYVHFTFKQADISDYFISWIEVHLSDKNRDDTVSLIKLINGVQDLPNDPTTNARYEPEKFRNHVFDYIQSVGRVVKIAELSNAFWGNRDFLSNLIDEKDIDINQEFRAVPSVLTRLKKYTLTAGKIRLSFSKSDIDQGRVFPGDGNQIILENPVLRGKFDSLNE